MAGRSASSRSRTSPCSRTVSHPFSRNFFPFTPKSRERPSSPSPRVLIRWERRLCEGSGPVVVVAEAPGATGGIPISIPPLKRTNYTWRRRRGKGGHCMQSSYCADVVPVAICSFARAVSPRAASSASWSFITDEGKEEEEAIFAARGRSGLSICSFSRAPARARASPRVRLSASTSAWARERARLCYRPGQTGRRGPSSTKSWRSETPKRRAGRKADVMMKEASFSWGNPSPFFPHAKDVNVTHLTRPQGGNLHAPIGRSSPFSTRRIAGIIKAFFLLALPSAKFSLGLLLSDARTRRLCAGGGSGGSGGEPRRSTTSARERREWGRGTRKRRAGKAFPTLGKEENARVLEALSLPPLFCWWAS